MKQTTKHVRPFSSFLAAQRNSFFFDKPSFLLQFLASNFSSGLSHHLNIRTTKSKIKTRYTESRKTDSQTLGKPGTY